MLENPQSRFSSAFIRTAVSLQKRDEAAHISPRLHKNESSRSLRPAYSRPILSPRRTVPYYYFHMHCRLTDSKFLRRLPHRRVVVYDVIGYGYCPFFNIFLHGSAPENVFYIIFWGGKIYSYPVLIYLFKCLFFARLSLQTPIDIYLHRLWIFRSVFHHQSGIKKSWFRRMEISEYMVFYAPWFIKATSTARGGKALTNQVS